MATSSLPQAHLPAGTITLTPAQQAMLLCAIWGMKATQTNERAMRLHMLDVLNPSDEVITLAKSRA